MKLFYSHVYYLLRYFWEQKIKKLFFHLLRSQIIAKIYFNDIYKLLINRYIKSPVQFFSQNKYKFYLNLQFIARCLTEKYCTRSYMMALCLSVSFYISLIYTSERKFKIFLFFTFYFSSTQLSHHTLYSDNFSFLSLVSTFFFFQQLFNFRAAK